MTLTLSLTIHSDCHFIALLLCCCVPSHRIDMRRSSSSIYRLLSLLFLLASLSLTVCVSSQSLPSITHVSGCRDVGNSTHDCNTGVVLTVFGGPFSSVSAVLLASHYSCPILSSSSTNVTCKLPPISLDDESSYLNVSVQPPDQPPVLFDGLGVSSMGELATYSVSGCRRPAGTRTEGCSGGTAVMVVGRGFPSYVKQLEAGSTSVYNVYPINSTHLTFRLSSGALSFQWYNVFVNPGYGVHTSNRSAAVMYYGPPIVTTTYLCSDVGQRTGACHAGRQLGMVGSDFWNQIQNTSKAITVRIAEKYDCQAVTIVTMRSLYCYLPTVEAADENVWLSVRVNRPDEVGVVWEEAFWMANALRLDNARGCAQTAGNATVGCVGGEKVRLTGAGFTNGSLVSVGGLSVPSVLLNSTHIDIVLPLMKPNVTAAVNVTVVAGATGLQQSQVSLPLVVYQSMPTAHAE